MYKRQQQHPPPVQRGPQGLGELVLLGPGRHGRAERGEQPARGPFGGHGLSVGAGEARAQDPVGVVRGELSGELLGEGGAAGAGPAGDEQHPTAGPLAAGEGVEPGSHDVGAQLLELAQSPDEQIPALRREGHCGRESLTGRHGSTPFPCLRWEDP